MRTTGCNWLLVTILFLNISGISQKNAKQWIFSGGAGLDFTTDPPTPYNGSWQVYKSISSISDAAGNLLFYTDGKTIWKSDHSAMANGTGLAGESRHGVISVPDPGSPNRYYVFYVRDWGSSATFAKGLYYSTVELNAGNGTPSVTVKNTLVSSGYLAERITGTRHANGTDYWVVVKSCSMYNTLVWDGVYDFRAIHVSAAGVSTLASVSTFTYANGSNYSDASKFGQMKISPNGKKLASANYSFHSYDSTAGSFDLYDFDNSNGQVSNFVPLYNSPTPGNGYRNSCGFGVEFSPDGSKLYGTLANNYYYSNGSIIQWNLCSGNNHSVAATQTAIAIPTNTPHNGFADLQLGPDGKIYVAHYSIDYQSLSVIHHPNQYGSASGFSLSNVVFAMPYSTSYYLPNFMSSQFFLAGSVNPFTYSVNQGLGTCLLANFSSPLNPGSTGNCGVNSLTLQTVKWDFGDPASGAGNTSTLASPSHVFSAAGVYTVNMILDFGQGAIYATSQTLNVSGISFGTVNHSNVLKCFGVNTGTASYSIPHGQGYQYSWTNGSAVYITPSVNILSAGNWTSTVKDPSSGCTGTSYFTITQPSLLQASTSKSLVCHNENLQINANGGTSPYYYYWSNGNNAQSGNATLLGANSLTVTDANGCTTTQVYSVTPLPQLSVTSATVCLNTLKTLSVSGANSYTWSNNVTGPFYGFFSFQSGTFTVPVTGEDLNNCMNSTAALVEVVNCTSVGELNTVPDFRIFPNPTSGEVAVECMSCMLSVFDGAGRILVHEDIGKSCSVRLEKPGIYIARVKQGQSVYYSKVVVVK